jgi:hypothetical protein
MRLFAALLALAHDHNAVRLHKRLSARMAFAALNVAQQFRHYSHPSRHNA